MTWDPTRTQTTAGVFWVKASNHVHPGDVFFKKPPPPKKENNKKMPAIHFIIKRQIKLTALSCPKRKLSDWNKQNF